MSKEEVVARLFSHGHHFEILVDPEKAQLYKEGKISDVGEVVISDAVFKQIRTAKPRDKGMMMDDKKSAERVDKNLMMEVFGTASFLEVAKQILDKGEVQYTTEQLKEIIEKKKRRLITLIARQGIDPRTGAPHTPERIEAAIEQAKVKIDYNKPIEQQIKNVISDITAILPVTLETKRIELKIPIKYADRAKTIVKEMCTITTEKWYGNEWLVSVEIGAGMQEILFNKLNNITHGEVISRIL